MKADYVFLIVAVLVIATLLRILRSGRMREKYAALWLVVGAATVVVVLWPNLLDILAAAMGIQVSSNLLFFIAILLLLGVSLHLSLEVSTLEAETRTLAEEVALLRTKVSDAPTGSSETGPRSS